MASIHMPRKLNLHNIFVYGGSFLLNVTVVLPRGVRGREGLQILPLFCKLWENIKTLTQFVLISIYKTLPIFILHFDVIVIVYNEI